MTKPMTKASVKELRTRMEALLKDFAGLDVKVGNASFTSNSVTFKVECSQVSEDGTVLNRDADAFRSLARYYGVKADALGATFMVNGTEYVLTGVAARSRKYPFLAERRTDRKGFKFGEHTVRRALPENLRTSKGI
jgi:hypothetical protein